MPQRYRAFISYSSRDRRVGERVHRALERYRVPRALRGRETTVGPIPRTLAPIFRDRDDLHASESLGRIIEAALSNSTFLIVLCSPAAAASPWVNREIAEFKRLHGAERIIALLVDGAPVEFDVAARPDGAFPPALMRRVDEAGNVTESPAPEPFAPDLRDAELGGDGFDSAILKTVARLIETPLAELTQREREAERRERRFLARVSIALAGLAVAAVVGGAFAVMRTIEARNRLDDAIAIAARQIDLAASYRDRYGVPTEVIRELLASARADFASITEGAGGDDALLLQRARLSLLFNELYAVVGDPAAQDAALGAALADLERLSADRDPLVDLIRLRPRPSIAVVDAEWLRYFDAAAERALADGDAEGARDAAHEAIAFAERHIEVEAEGDWLRELSLSYMRLGRVAYDLGDLIGAEAAYSESVALLETPGVAAAAQPYPRELFDALSELATTNLELDEREIALAQERRAIDLARVLVDRAPDNTDVRRSLMIVLARYADTLIANGEAAADVLEIYAEASVLADGLLAADPLRVDWRRDRALLNQRIGGAELQRAYYAPDERDAALAASEAAFLRSLDDLRRLLRASPDDLLWLRDESVTLEGLGQLRLARVGLAFAAGDVEEAERMLALAIDALSEAVSDRERLLELSPATPIARHDLAVALMTLGGALTYDAERSDAARAALDRAIQMFETMTADADAPPSWRREMALAFKLRSDYFSSIGAHWSAYWDVRRAIDEIEFLRRRSPSIAQYAEDEVGLRAQSAALQAILFDDAPSL